MRLFTHETDKLMDRQNELTDRWTDVQTYHPIVLTKTHLKNVGFLFSFIS